MSSGYASDDGQSAPPRKAEMSGLPADYQAISRRLRKNFPVTSWGASSANQTAVSAPSSTESVAFGPPMSVRTHPGHMELTAMWSARSASASMIVKPLSASFDRQ